MDKLKLQTANKADENFKKLAEMFPNVVTETINENGEVVRAIDKDVLMQEINTKVVDGREERYQFTWPDKKNLSCLRMRRSIKPFALAEKKALTLITPKTSISRAITLKC